MGTSEEKVEVLQGPVEPDLVDFETGAIFVRNMTGMLLRVMSPDNKNVLWPKTKDLVVPAPLVSASVVPISLVPTPAASAPTLPTLPIPRKTKPRKVVGTRSHAVATPVVREKLASPISQPVQKVPISDLQTKLASFRKEELLKLREAFERGNDDFFESYLELRLDGLSLVFLGWAGQLLLSRDIKVDLSNLRTRDSIMGAVDALLSACIFLGQLSKLDALSTAIEKEFAPYEVSVLTTKVDPVTLVSKQE